MPLAPKKKLRKDNRVELQLMVDYKCEDNFLFEYSSNLSQNGIFLLTQKPLSPGTRLELRFDIEDQSDAPYTIKVLGEVIWVNVLKTRKSSADQVGMGIKFVNLDAVSKEKIRALVKRIAIL